MKGAQTTGPVLRAYFGWALGTGHWALLAALVPLGLCSALSRSGFRGTGDSYYYLSAAHRLCTSDRLLGPDGLPYRLWGPCTRPC